MQKGCLFLWLLIGTCWCQAQENPRWLRYCSISPDGHSIAFVYQGNLYKVPAGGGEAQRLTSGPAYHFMPVWSHDGQSLAFASDRSGNFDIYILPATGGEPKRLTYHSTDEFPYDFTPDNKAVIFGATRMDAAGNRQFPSEALRELYQVPVTGGRVEQMLTTPAEFARFSPDGRFVAYHDRKGRENLWRKHQQSSMATDLWFYNTHTGHHTRITNYKGEDRNPVFADSGKAIYYLSEESGSFNVHRLTPDEHLFQDQDILKDQDLSKGQDLSNSRQSSNGSQHSSKDSMSSSSRQITFFKNHPVRFLSISRDQTLCFGYDGEIYLQRKNGPSKKVLIKIKVGPMAGGIIKKNNPGSIDNKRIAVEEQTIPIKEVDEMTLSPTGQEMAFIFRGEVFLSGLRDANTKGQSLQRITYTPGHEAGLSFSPDGNFLLYASERGDGWKIYQTAIDRDKKENKEKALIENEKENYQPRYSPDGKEIAFIEDRTTLKIYNLVSGQSRMILNSSQLVSRKDNDQIFEWSPDGKWLLVQFVEPGAGNEEVGIISTDGKGKLINLTQSGFSDIHPKWAMGGKMITWFSDRNGLHSYANSSTRQYEVYGLLLNGKEGIGNKRKEPEKLSTQPSLLTDALVSSDGRKLYFLARAEKKLNLWVTDLQKKETNLLAALQAEEATMQWGAGEKNIFLLADGKIMRIDLTRADGPMRGISAIPAIFQPDSIIISGEMTYQPAAERRAMFEHVWRTTKETFYTAGLHGVDWDAYKKSYLNYLPYINNNFDFAEMLNELLGELNVSHTGCTFTNPRKDGDITASLGAFFNTHFKDSGLQIEEIISDGPLDDTAFIIGKGAIITAIDGESILPDRDFAQYLNHKAGKKIRLTIRDIREGNQNQTKEISIKPISPAQEEALLYKRWMKRNENETDRLSKGQLGYVHLYRMNDAAYRKTYEDVLGKYAGRKGIVVDTRFNRGGDLASELIQFLSGIRVRDNTAGPFLLNSEPAFRWTKPSIVLAGEANYSDGHCFVYDYQYLHLGKWVGMPVPGSCTFLTGQTLQDPSLHWSLATWGVKTLQGNFLENYQTEPDIRIRNGMEEVGTGRDQQLEEAVKVLMQESKAGGQ